MVQAQKGFQTTYEELKLHHSATPPDWDIEFPDYL